MTISTTINRVDFAGNDVTTTPFATGFKFYADTDLSVILVNDATGVETPQVLTTDYTVTGAGEDAGGDITMVVAPATGETLVIVRAQPYTQGLDLVENDDFPSDSVEEQLDKITIMTQQNLDSLDRSIKLPEGFTATFDATLPVDVNTAEAIITVTAGGTAFEMKTLVALDALGLPVSFVNGGTGASYANLAALLAGWNMEIGTDIQAHDANTAKTDVEQAWTAAQYFSPQTDDTSTAGAITFDFASSNYIEFTLTENLTAITLSNVDAGKTCKLRLKQHASSAKTVTGWPASVVWQDGDTDPVMNTTVGAYTMIVIDGGTTEHLGFYADVG